MSVSDKIKTVGVMAASAVATAAAIFGFKSYHDAHAHDAEEAAGLQRQLAEKRLRMAEVSQEWGKNNPQGNFRASVRGGGAGVDATQPNVSQPDLLG